MGADIRHALQSFPTDKPPLHGTRCPYLITAEIFVREGQKRDVARRLRREMTPAERRLWEIVRKRQVDGHRFRRQCPIGPYVVDFACLEARIALEADGGQHLDSRSDAIRDAHLRKRGFRVLRFWNNEILANPEGVRAVIALQLAEACPHPDLPPHAGEGANQDG